MQSQVLYVTAEVTFLLISWLPEVFPKTCTQDKRVGERYTAILHCRAATARVAELRGCFELEGSLIAVCTCLDVPLHGAAHPVCMFACVLCDLWKVSAVWLVGSLALLCHH